MTAADPDGPEWNPAQYSKFSEFRVRPADDLLARVALERPGRIVDLGCGSGDLTRTLARRWPTAAITAVDRSAAMLAATGAGSARITFEQGDIRTWAPAAAVDLVFSNAALNWVAGHAGLLPRLIATLAPRGVLAVQMPLNHAAASHRLLRQTLADGGGRGQPFGPPKLLAALKRRPVAAPARYYEILAGLVEQVDIWDTTYLHALSGTAPVLEWMAGTTLRPVFAALTATDREAFMEIYAARLAAAYPRRPDGITLFPFRRLFIVARR